ncbi:hypothetical protein [Paenibacillus macerans]|uniref:hypothetical protein n=1 Tax=Paenibacillus macerans TaxID=44252 RepID=UPI003D299C55
MVGVGGGAASLIVYFAEKMGLKYSIPENAEVISSIGVALAMVRDVVERIIPSPSKEDISAIKMEAMNKAIQSGATPESVEIHIDIDPQTSKGHRDCHRFHGGQNQRAAKGMQRSGTEGNRRRRHADFR